MKLFTGQPDITQFTAPAVSDIANMEILQLRQALTLSPTEQSLLQHRISQMINSQDWNDLLETAAYFKLVYPENFDALGLGGETWNNVVGFLESAIRSLPAKLITYNWLYATILFPEKTEILIRTTFRLNDITEYLNRFADYEPEIIFTTGLIAKLLFPTSVSDEYLDQLISKFEWTTRVRERKVGLCPEVAFIKILAPSLVSLEGEMENDPHLVERTLAYVANAKNHYTFNSRDLNKLAAYVRIITARSIEMINGNIVIEDLPGELNADVPLPDVLNY